MLENGKISARQYMILTILFITGGTILFVPAGLTAGAKQDAWIAGILGVSLSVLLVWLYTTLGSRFPKRNLGEYCEIIFGKWLGKTVFLLFLSFIFLLCAFGVRNMGDFLTTQILTETPIEAIFILYLGILIMGTRLGLETIARAAELLFPWVILLLLIMMILITPQIKIENIQPVFSEGLQPILKTAISFMGIPFLQLFILLMIFPYVNRTKEAKISLFAGLLIGGAFLIGITLLSILVLGADTTARQLYPSYVLARKINVGDFLQRIEAVIAEIWLITLFFKSTILFYATSLGTAQLLKVRDYRFFTFPLGIILIVLSIVISPNIVYYNLFVEKIWTPYALFFGLILPLIMLVVAAVRRKRG